MKPFVAARNLSDNSLPNSILSVCVNKKKTNLCNDLGQARVAHDQPAPGCDSVGLVLKLLRVHLIEIFEPE